MANSGTRLLIWITPSILYNTQAEAPERAQHKLKTARAALASLDTDMALVELASLNFIRSEVNKQVEKRLEEDARAVSVSWVLEDAAPSRKDRLAGQGEDEDFDEWASSDDESDGDVRFEDHGVSANGTYVHAANHSDMQKESDLHVVSGGSEHDEEGARGNRGDYDTGCSLLWS
jgi:hypothetical protein